MRRKKITFKLHGETEFDQDLIDSAPRQGRFDDFADEILRDYDVEVTLDDSIKYLKLLGAWDESELQDLETNKSRLLWIALLDCQEQETTFWYMGG